MEVTQLSPRRREMFEDTGDLDIAFSYPMLPRFRVNGFRQRGATSFAFRVIPSFIPDFDSSACPRASGGSPRSTAVSSSSPAPTGSGKTTTLASMIDHINRTRRSHIVTIEDPIEILHPDRGCIVNQREVGLDTLGFEQALRRVLRQDPDIILIGELRDTETAQAALQAAESGHLVFSTLHTIDCAETIGRMIELFPPAKQEQVRSILAGTLRGVVSQRLLPKRRRRPGPGGRGDGLELPHPGADPREPHRRDHRRDRRRRLLRHAELRAVADRPRARGRGRPRDRRRTPRRTGTTSSSRSSAPSATSVRSRPRRQRGSCPDGRPAQAVGESRRAPRRPLTRRSADESLVADDRAYPVPGVCLPHGSLPMMSAMSTPRAPVPPFARRASGASPTSAASR